MVFWKDYETEGFSPEDIHAGSTQTNLSADEIDSCLFLAFQQKIKTSTV
jgi:hypothetical protein